MQSNHVAIRAEGVLSFKVHDGDVTADVEDLSTVHVSYNEESDQPEHECSKCHRELTDHSGLGIFQDEDNEMICPDGEPHHPVAAPLTWVKSASINPDPDEDSITVAVSVGDPRGAFCMTLRRLGDTILLYLPHSAMPSPHMPLARVRAGVYQVGS